MIFWYQTVRQPDVVFVSESIGSNFCSVVQPGGKKKIFSIFLQTNVTSRRGRFGIFFGSNIFFSPPGCAREQKLRPFDSESKTTSGCSNNLISKKITPKSLFSFHILIGSSWADIRILYYNTWIWMRINLILITSGWKLPMKLET